MMYGMTFVTTARATSARTFVERCRHGDECHDGLNHRQDDHPDNRCTHPVSLREDGRKHALVRRGFSGLCERELPAKQQSETGHHREQHHDGAGRGSEHVGIGEPERPRRLRQFGIRHDALNDSGGEDVDDRGTGCSKKACQRNIPLRILDGTRVLGRRLHTKKRQERQADAGSNTADEADPLRIPCSGERCGLKEPEPSDDGDQADRQNDSPDGHRPDAPGDAWASEVRDG